MRKDQEFIFSLRREGRSYRYINKATGVSRGTLSRWFKGQEWSKHISIAHDSQSPARSRERMYKMNMVRKLKLQYEYALAIKEAESEYLTYKKDPLFWSGILSYLEAGDMKTASYIRLTSSKPFTHKVFKAFCSRYFGISQDKISFMLTLYKTENLETALDFWEKKLDLGRDYFYKTQFIKGNDSKKRLQFGFGATIISSTSFKKKLVRWIELAQNEASL